jgi:hypothetical protein
MSGQRYCEGQITGFFNNHNSTIETGTEEVTVDSRIQELLVRISAELPVTLTGVYSQVPFIPSAEYGDNMNTLNAPSLSLSFIIAFIFHSTIYIYIYIYIHRWNKKAIPVNRPWRSIGL